MKNIERVFYVVIILIQFFLIFYITKKASNLKKQENEHLSEMIQDIRGKNIFSFFGTNAEGGKIPIIFNAYSSQIYIFLNISEGCAHCDEFLFKLKEFLMDKIINEKIKFIVVSSSRIVKIDSNQVMSLELSSEDCLQFGLDTPSVFATNGKGEILFHDIGYRDGLFDYVLKLVQDRILKKSEKISDKF